MSRYQITDDDLPFAAEFKAAPRGPHSPGLQRVLNRMRTDTGNGKYVLLVDEPFKRWRLARSPCRRGAGIEPVEGYSFTDLADAERTVFALRWRELTGKALVLPDDEQGNTP